MMLRTFILFSFLFLLVFSSLFAQSSASQDIMDYYVGKERFFRSSQSFLYKADEFPVADELKGEELKKASSYFRVFYDDDDRPKSSGYYTKQRDFDAGVDITKLAQYVNRDNLPYHVVRYEYNYLASPDLVSEKYFKDEAGKVINYYRYTWDDSTLKLSKLERFGKNPYVGDMELKGYSSLVWEGDNLKRVIFFNDARKRIEQYTFVDNFVPSGSLDATDAAMFGVGNNRVSISVLSKYERYRVDNDRELIYYILYSREGEGLREAKYNSDRVLLKEKFYSSFSSTN